MGTRSLTFVYDNNKPIVNMYRQYDGYPSGHGAELVDFLSAGRLVNGLIHSKTAEEVVFNGMGCLAASLIAHFKKSPGGFYIHSVDSKECGQDFEYHIYAGEENKGFKIKVFNCGVNFFGLTQSEKHDKMFEGNLFQFAEFCSAEELA